MWLSENRRVPLPGAFRIIAKYELAPKATAPRGLSEGTHPPPLMTSDEQNWEPQTCYLKPAELVVCQFPTRITTVLGTCVAVCLFDPVTKIGGMNHYMLPRRGEGVAFSLKYGDMAIATLIDKMVKAGAVEKELRAKVFGGLEGAFSLFRIGYRNTEVAIDLLKKRKITIDTLDVGGVRSRKIIFCSWNHQVIGNFLENEIYAKK